MISAGQRGSGSAGQNTSKGRRPNGKELSRCPSAPRPRLRNAEKLMRLKAQPPARMCQAVVKRGIGVGLLVRTIHGLQKELPEGKPLEQLGLGACLGKNQLDLVPTLYGQACAGLRADTQPVDSWWWGQRPVCLDGHLEACPVEGGQQRLIELKEWLAPGAHHEPSARSPRRPGIQHRARECFGSGE